MYVCMYVCIYIYILHTCEKVGLHRQCSHLKFFDYHVYEKSPDLVKISLFRKCYIYITYIYYISYIYYIYIIGIQALGRSGQRREFSQATGMALVRCNLSKFLGVACHCFPPLFRCSHFSPPGASTSSTT